MLNMALRSAATPRLPCIAANLVARTIICYAPLAHHLQRHATFVRVQPKVCVGPSTTLMTLMPLMMPKSQKSSAQPRSRPVKPLVKTHNNNIEATYPGVASL